MGLPQELDEYIKESIEDSLGLPISQKTLSLKLQASEEARKRLQDQYFFLHDKLKEKDEIVERTRAEASLNAQALKKFIEENQKLAVKCANLLIQCSKWEKECSLYDHDREALMEFGNEADERAKKAEIRLLEVEDELRKLAEEVKFYKDECATHMVSERRATEELHMLKVLKYVMLESGDSSEIHTLEGHLLASVVEELVDKDKVAAITRVFLEASSGIESYQRLLNIWEHLRLSSKNVLFLVAEFKRLQEDTEHLRINLHRAEKEVKLLFEENKILDEENQRLVRQWNRERNHPGSGGKQTNASAKGTKRKCSPKMSNPIERITDFNVPGSPRRPLSPLQHNSPDFKMH